MQTMANVVHGLSRSLKASFAVHVNLDRKQARRPQVVPECFLIYLVGNAPESCQLALSHGP